MIEPEFIDDENIPLLERDENNDSVYEDTQTETSFSHDDVIQQDIEKIDREINALERGFNVKIPPEERSRFRISGNHLQVRIHKKK